MEVAFDDAHNRSSATGSGARPRKQCYVYGHRSHALGVSVMQGPAMAAVDRRNLTAWYDGDCPICTAEVGLIGRLDRASAIEFVDLSLPGGCPTDRATRLARLHAQPRDGRMVSGAAAFVAMWRVLPPLRPLATLASPPPILWLLERAYLLFLKLRPPLQALVRWGLAQRAHKR